MIALLLGAVLGQINRQPYSALGVDIYATLEEVKAAYERLKASPEFSDEARKKEVSEAFALLSVPAKRKAHDRKNSPPKREKNPYINEKDPDPVRIRVPLPVEAALKGYNLTLRVIGDQACPRCGGTGTEQGKEKCGRCNGQGEISKIENGQQVKTQCPACKGSKVKSSAGKCEKCKGAKTFKGGEVSKTIRVEKGYPENQELTVPNLVDEVTAEDAIYVFETVEQDGWSRKGADLQYLLDVSLKESILGLSRTVQHLDGSAFEITKDSVRNGEKLSFPGRGVPLFRKEGQRGNLQVEARIRLEEDMSEEVRDRWEHFFRRHHL